jgi:hypothetical protein
MCKKVSLRSEGGKVRMGGVPQLIFDVKLNLKSPIRTFVGTSCIMIDPTFLHSIEIDFLLGNTAHHIPIISSLSIPHSSVIPSCSELWTAPRLLE